MDAREGVAFLTGSEGRVAVLRLLAETPCRPCELRERTEASRTAIHRALTGFEERGWVRKDDNRYALTAAGRHVHEQYEELAAAVETGDRFSEFLTTFPRADDLPFPFDGEVRVATPTEPQAPRTFFHDRLPADADRFRGFTPVLTQRLAESLEPTVEAGTEVELVYDESYARQALQSYPETMELAMRTDSVTIHVVPDSIEAGLAIVDGEVFLKAYGSRGDLRACLHSTDERLHGWASDWFEQVRSGSRSLERFAPETPYCSGG
ncbi:helix-turn-helix transcriptional regulator [Haloglomus halophilum]|uniref:helix-turn-helix transcriptional regulator n=1 Tax=Haloglomus halophilum TaxID=2962672 RepID=UPI0020C973DF|nr:helix-turn-helix domain-containing protein [Haloglomus halophilum]